MASPAETDSYTTVIYRPSQAAIPADTLTALTTLINAAFAVTEGDLFEAYRLNKGRNEVTGQPLTAQEQFLAEIMDGWTICLFSTSSPSPSTTTTNGIPTNGTSTNGTSTNGTSTNAQLPALSIIGTVSLQTFDPTPEHPDRKPDPYFSEWQVKLLAVATNAGRRGVGGRLLREAEKLITREAVATPERPIALLAFTVTECNLVEFYRRYGYEIVGDQIPIPKGGAWQSVCPFSLWKMRKALV